MPRAPHAATRARAEGASHVPSDPFVVRVKPGAGGRSRFAASATARTPMCTTLRRWTLVWAALLAILWIEPALAQDWGESDDDWSSAPDAAPSGGANAWNDSASSPWSLRMGAGFTIDPNNFLMNFELPYRFDQYVSAGLMMQIGLEDEKLLVAPTANVTVHVPNLPGESFDRFHPNVFAGMGFAVIENDDRRGENTDSGFLVNAGFGVDYDLSTRVKLGSRMIFNFLPINRTLGQKFFYSWEVIGIQLSF